MVDGQLLRPLDAGETFFHQSDQVSSMNFVVLAERAGPLEPVQIQTALDDLQREHGLLQTAVVRDQAQQLHFQLRPQARIALRCCQIKHEDWQGHIGELLTQGFAEGEAPLMRCLYLEFANRHSILALCLHHSIADGRSAMALLQSLLNHLAGAALPAAAVQSLPAMAEVMPAAYRWSEQPEAAQALKPKVVSDYRRHGAMSPLPWLDHTGPSSTPQLARLQLDTQTTQGLLARARSQATTLHAALCAAQLLATSRLQPELDAQVLMLASPVDMRKRLAMPVPTTPTGLFVSIISSSHRIETDTTLWPLAREIRQQMQAQLERGEGHLFYALYGLDGPAPDAAQTATLKKKLLASVPNTMVSNIGTIEAAAADPLLRNLSFALFPMPYQSLFTAASTYGDQLTLNIGFNAARLGPHADRLINSLEELLIQSAA